MVRAICAKHSQQKFQARKGLNAGGVRSKKPRFRCGYRGLDPFA